jgi:hypothetical protein
LIEVKLLRFENVLSAIEVNDVGSITVVNLLQPEKAVDGSEVIEMQEPKLRVVRLLQLANALLPIVLTEAGKFKLPVNPLQPLNAEFPIKVKEVRDEKLIEVKLLMFKNVLSGIEVNDVGSVTVVKLLQP